MTMSRPAHDSQKPSPETCPLEAGLKDRAAWWMTKTISKHMHPLKLDDYPMKRMEHKTCGQQQEPRFSSHIQVVAKFIRSLAMQ